MDNSANAPVIQNQLPDESDIERLFPRCRPPNEKPPNQRVKSKFQPEPAANFQAGKQAKTKVQQQARRQTKARRSRSASQGAKKAKGSEAASTAANIEKASDSSDEDNNPRVGHAAARSVNYHANCGHPATGEPAPVVPSRKLKTYRASQSLSQQLKKSHSSYNTATSNGAPHVQTNQTSQISHSSKSNSNEKGKTNDSVNKPRSERQKQTPAHQDKPVVRGPTGIVKSHSAYAGFLNEPGQSAQMPTITEAQVETELEPTADSAPAIIQIPSQVPAAAPAPVSAPASAVLSTVVVKEFDPIPMGDPPETELEKELDAAMDELVERDLEPEFESVVESERAPEKEPEGGRENSPDDKTVARQEIEKDLSLGIDRIALNNISQFNSSSANSTANITTDLQQLTTITTTPTTKSCINTEGIKLAGLAKPRSSSLQFNTLSDDESDTDDPSLSNHQVDQTPMLSARTSFNSTDIANKCDLKLNSHLTMATELGSASIGAAKSDEDLTPTAKTALIFPRLDEGLSSEAESNEDEVDEDDERGMEADVDADDDEEDDDDDDDDDDDEDEDIDEEGDSHNIHIGSSRSRIDSYINKQMKSLSIHNQQPTPQNVPSSSSLDQTDLTNQQQPNKTTTNPSYSSYIGGNEHLEHNDIKPMNNNNNYSNQNGQTNYWNMNGPNNNQTSIPAPQATSSQLYNNQIRNHHNSNNNSNSTSSSNNNSLVIKNNSFSREEAKATSRLSSDTDNETDRLLGSQRSEQLKMSNNNNTSNNNSNNNSDPSSNSEVQPVSNVMKPTNANSREVLIEGVLFGVKYLGSTHSDCEGRAEKEDRIQQAEMAVHEVKFRNGDSQMGTEVQLFISTEKIMVLDDKQRRIMMDHSLRTISYIADIGDAIVLIVRKKNSSNELGELGRPVSKISCHVFESNESHTITKSISQAFQVAYTELLKANGAGEVGNYLPKELDYQEVLNSQEMSTDHLEMFARKENQREVVVPKKKGEILGLSIIESGWGSVLPTVVIANLKQDGPAYNCKKLSIGDQILSVNGVSLVGLPLSECQDILKKTKDQRVAKLSVVPCPVTVEVKIKRPDTKYQLGFSVQNGVICSLLRGGIAERGGVRVGHRIMSINGTTVVGVPHEKIVTLLASSVGEIRMETCLTSLYRLMLGEENPVHF